MRVRPTGVIPPMTTPFLKSGEIDFSRAPMPEASSSQAAAIANALEGLGALAGRRVEAAE